MNGVALVHTTASIIENNEHLFYLYDTINPNNPGEQKNSSQLWRV